MSGALEAVAVVLLLSATGYFIAAFGWLGKDGIGFLSKFVVKVCVPALIITNMTSFFDREALLRFMPLLVPPFVCVLLLFLIAYALGIAIKVDKKRIGCFASACCVSNTIFIGLPVASIIYGDACMEGVMASFLSTTLACWTFVWFSLIHDGSKLKLSVTDVLKKFFLNPPVIGLIIGFLLVLLDFSLPSILDRVLGYLAATVTPLSMIYVGAFIHSVSLKSLIPDRDTILALIFRCVIAPLLMYFVMAVFLKLGFTASMVTVDVMILLQACCGMGQLPILAGEAGSDAEFASRTVCLSNFAFLITLPVLSMILAG